MNWTESYLRIPFQPNGEGRNGCDCWGLVKLILREQLGREITDYSDARAGDLMAQARTLSANADTDPEWQKVDRSEVKQFDAVVMRGHVRHEGRLTSRPVHVGMVVRPGTLIHIEKGAGVTVVNYDRHPKVRGRVIGFYRLRNA